MYEHRCVCVGGGGVLSYVRMYTFKGFCSYCVYIIMNQFTPLYLDQEQIRYGMLTALV